MHMHKSVSVQSEVRACVSMEADVGVCICLQCKGQVWSHLGVNLDVPYWMNVKGV